MFTRGNVLHPVPPTKLSQIGDISCVPSQNCMGYFSLQGIYIMHCAGPYCSLELKWVILDIGMRGSCICRSFVHPLQFPYPPFRKVLTLSVRFSCLMRDPVPLAFFANSPSVKLGCPSVIRVTGTPTSWWNLVRASWASLTLLIG